jgi:hypothetical protein
MRFSASTRSITSPMGSPCWENGASFCTLVAERWHQARQRHKDELLRIDGDERFNGLQRFFVVVHQLTSERRLSKVFTFWRNPDPRSGL